MTILWILLLIVWIYLSIAFTLFFIELRKWDNEAKKMKAKMDKRDEILNKMLHLLYKIDTKTYLNKK